MFEIVILEWYGLWRG